MVAEVAGGESLASRRCRVQGIRGRVQGRATSSRSGGDRSRCPRCSRHVGAAPPRGSSGASLGGARQIRARFLRAPVLAVRSDPCILPERKHPPGGRIWPVDVMLLVVSPCSAVRGAGCDDPKRPNSPHPCACNFLAAPTAYFHFLKTVPRLNEYPLLPRLPLGDLGNVAKGSKCGMPFWCVQRGGGREYCTVYRTGRHCATQYISRGELN